MRTTRYVSDEFGKESDEIYLTEEGFARLKERLAHLKKILPNLIAETQRTAAYGDRSDNAEYKLAKSSLRRTNWQILSIEDQIKRVVVITMGPNASGTVHIGSTVVLKTEGPEYSRGTEGAEKIFQIVGSQETDPSKERISYQSPLGAALMGRAKGDSVTIKTASGSRTYHILKIR